MRVEEMALRSEIRQMLNEAGFNKNTIKDIVKETINDVVNRQVDQAVMEHRKKDIAGVVEDALDRRMYSFISDCCKSAIKDKMRYYDFKVNVEVNDESKKEEDMSALAKKMIKEVESLPITETASRLVSEVIKRHCEDSANG